MGWIYVIYSLSLIVSTISAVDRVVLPDDHRTYLIEMLTKTHQDTSPEHAQELVYELENFYTGVRDNLWTDCGPPDQIDKAFHLHIINTRFYERFSQATFGRFVHHSPFWSAHLPPTDLRKRCGNQVRKLRNHGVAVIYDHLWAVPACGVNGAHEDDEVWRCDL